MKRIIICGLFLTTIFHSAHAQWLRVWQAGESTRYALSEAATIPYTKTSSILTIGNDEYATSEIDSITIVNPVTITWDGATATVDIPESVEGVTAEVTNGDVIITNANEWTEQEFILKGSSTAGSFTYNGTYKAKFHLNDVNLTSASGAAIDIQCGKRIDLILVDGTTNSLSDYAQGSQKAAFNCQGHLEVSGSGALNIKGNANHALRTKEYLLLKKSTGAIIITKAASDGIHCGEYFQMNGGSISISGQASDGLQVEADAASLEPLNGQFIMNDGSINVTLTATDTKGLRLDGLDGNTSFTPEMYINNGTVTVDLTATANGSKAIASDGNFTIGTSSTSPTINITVAGDVYTDPDTDEENRATGLKADKTLTIAGGNTTVYATGNKSRGVRANTLIATGGTLTVSSTGNKSQGIKLDEIFTPGQGGTVNGKFKY